MIFVQLMPQIDRSLLIYCMKKADQVQSFYEIKIFEFFAI